MLVLRFNDKRLACGVLLIATGIALPAAADQFVALDVTYTATSQNTTDSHYPVDPKAGIPANWKSPVDYASGNAYVQLDILEKPSAVKTLYNICFENSSNYACMPYGPAYTAVGRDDFTGAFSAFYQTSLIDWTKGVSKIQLILKDEKEAKPQGSADFYPTKVHVIITIVAPGSTYVPPGGQAGSGAGGAAAGGRSGTSGASGSSMPTAGVGGRGANAGNGSGRAGAAATAGKGGTKADSGAPASSTPQAGRMSGSSGTVANSQAGTKGGGMAGSGDGAGGNRSVSSLLHTNGGCSVTNASGGSMRWSTLGGLGLALAVRRCRLRRSRQRRP